jgi:hypothetical protein
MFQFRWGWLRRDPEWIERAPELKQPFERIREGFREWNFRAMPVMLLSAILFGLAMKCFG